LLIFFYRYYLINNPFYPLFSNFFNPGDQQLLDWENTLRGWDRTSFFPFWLFIPKSIGKISFVLGPSNLLLIIASIIYFLSNLNSNNPRLTVGLCQFILLILFSQGRADYYMSPLILVSFGIPSLSAKQFKYLTIKLNKILRIFLLLIVFCQLMMFIISCLYSIALVFYVIYDYESGMNKTAYNFYNSKIIENYAEMPVYNQVTGMTHLYFDSPFVANQSFDKCFYYDKNIPEDQKYKNCMIKKEVNSIIVEKDRLKNNISFSCKSNELIRASRNIFLEKKIPVDICQLN